MAEDKKVIVIGTHDLGKKFAALVADMVRRVDEFRALYRKVNHEHRLDMLPELYRLQAELVIAGYRIENAWGHYLHTPDGQVIVLDTWNENLDK